MGFSATCEYLRRGNCRIKRVAGRAEKREDRNCRTCENVRKTTTGSVVGMTGPLADFPDFPERPWPMGKAIFALRTHLLRQSKKSRRAVPYPRENYEEWCGQLQVSGWINSTQARTLFLFLFRFFAAWLMQVEDVFFALFVLPLFLCILLFKTFILHTIIY